MIELAREDERFRAFFKEVRNYLDLTVKNPDLLLDEEYQKTLSHLMDVTSDWVNDPKYRDRLDVIWGDLR